ncbi:MAG: ATP-binding protein [Candidatus Mcinerneyibacterium aminivorans]|uniref:ATP-binding protein n=1 Tax=Candidatus Mcinerneyibacterium aminivorans TaxID=2703815 RepID=A0A5D0MI79_9BACT|nr:MAG: ATP-binding protein [Candidatus Mcinerneyibacterium aminivorans]
MDFSLILPAKYKYLQLIRIYVVQILENAGIDQDIIDDIRNIIGEASSNVVKHAYNNIEDAEKTIEINIDIKKKNIIIEIIDRGKGFETNYLENLTQAEIKKKLDKRNKGGWGLYLIKKISDKVEFEINPYEKNVIRVYKKY